MVSLLRNRTPDGLDRDALVAGAYDTRMFKLGAKTKAMFAGGRKIDVRVPTEKMIVLPNGHTVRVSRDDSGCATQIEENDRLHGVARPNTYNMKLSQIESPHLDIDAERRAFVLQAEKLGVRIPRKVRQSWPNAPK